MPGSAGENLSHEHYGEFHEVPHTRIDCSWMDWAETAQEVLEYKIGPPVAWEFTDDALHLWGEQLDEELLRDLSDACHDLKQESSAMDMFEAAQSASRMESKFIGADIEAPAATGGGDA
jgi:hypothetical protein